MTQQDYTYLALFFYERGREAAKGYSYKYSNLQDRDLHRMQHKYDNNEKINKERPN